MNIRQHKLTWRWTDNQYAALPEDVLGQLRSIGEEEAIKLHKRVLAHLGKDALSHKFTSRIIGTERLSVEDGSNWLRQMQPTPDAEIVLSWDPTVALQTSWAIFVQYWQDFCYPASDDLVVLPFSGNWVLLYHHEEEFHFGVPKIDA